MLTLEEYKKDPSGTLSIPYYKAKSIALPAGITVVHERDMDPSLLDGASDEPYFRLIHRLESVASPISEAFVIRTAGEGDIPIMADIILRSYADTDMTAEGLVSLRAKEVFDPELWVIAFDARALQPAACGIAELDAASGEASLEWIQTLPGSRRMGAGRLTVLELLTRLKGRAEFATVSGRILDPNSPEKLYRSCGFEGNDVWHVLRRGMR